MRVCMWWGSVSMFISISVYPFQHFFFSHYLSIYLSQLSVNNAFLILSVRLCLCLCLSLSLSTGPRDRTSIPVRSYQRLKKRYLISTCLTISIIRHGSRVKCSNLGKGVAPSPTPWGSSY